MYYVTLDTCVLIDLGKNFRNIEIIRSLRKLIDQEQITLIIPKIIQEEWDKHKTDKIYNYHLESIRSKIRNYKDIIHLSGQMCDAIEDNEIEQLIQRKAISIINEIDALLEHSNTKVITINNEVKLQSIDWAVLNKAPMHKKNSMKDTLIILSSLYYTKSHRLSPYIFISSNYKDFANEADKKAIHSDIEELASEIEFMYFSNIGEALNHIEAGLISDELVQQIELDSSVRKCYECGATMNEGSWRPSRYGGLTWQYTCYSCGARYDTGEFWI
ncbi:MAG: DUF4935 domain-containing protein [Clostridia bacterium]|nr:DUF4935 domain-containing protein [Clostridia bacterium]